MDSVKQEHLSDSQVPLRRALEERLLSPLVSPSDKLNNLGLYLKTGSLSHILFINELYELVSDRPGVVMEFGCWLGQNLVLFENLRAIHEPFNKLRKIIGFDTFTGYVYERETDAETSRLSHLDKNVYRTDAEYAESLRSLMALHEKNNVLGHVVRNEIVKGDIVETLPRYLQENDHTIVALAYFDMAMYEPTIAAMRAIKPHLVPGSVLLLDEFNHPTYRGDTQAFREVFSDSKYTIRLSRFMREKTIVVFE